MPVQYPDFVRSKAARVRYWARSTVGWARFSAAQPNGAHLALAQLEEGGVVQGIITQNVDGLHQVAGSRRVVELHGSMAWVRCLECGHTAPRDEYQRRLLTLNAGWIEELSHRTRSAGVEAAPDGDAELPPFFLDGFRVADCDACSGIIKPDVVFFGENVPPARVEQGWRLLRETDVLLVVGSSLTVYSGRRFIYRAQNDGIPIAIINMGPTRADAVAAAKVEGRLGLVLPRLAEALLAIPAPVNPRCGRSV